MSLDGFIARADGTIDWLDAVAAEGEDYGYGAYLAGIDTVLLGRRTFDTVRGFEVWPYAGRRVVVLTRDLDRSPVHGEEYSNAPLPELLDQLGVSGSRQVYVDGGAAISAAITAGALDRLTVSIIPVVLGTGRPLFRLARGDRPLELESVRSWPSGLVQLAYGLGPGTRPPA